MNSQVVVVAEDNPADLKLIQITIGSSFPDFKFVYLKDGDELLNFLSTHADAPSIELVIMDYNMPKLNAQEVLVELRKNQTDFKSFPIVIFSSSNNYPDIQSCYELGANAYVVKPIDFDAFEERMHKIINFWLPNRPTIA